MAEQSICAQQPGYSANEAAASDMTWRRDDAGAQAVLQELESSLTEELN